MKAGSTSRSRDHRRRPILHTAALALLAALLGMTAPIASARVDRVEITSRSPVADGRAFGRAGAYELVVGRLHYSVDPADPGNRTIVDLPLAPRDASGRVAFSGDFTLLRPAAGSRSNGRLLYEVNNRGNYRLLDLFQDSAVSNAVGDAAAKGNDWLLAQGYSLLWTGWNWDVQPGNGRQTIDLPVARQADGQPITGPVISEIFVNAPTRAAAHAGLLAIGYPFADGAQAKATLTVRDKPDGPRTTIAREQWTLARIDQGREVADDRHVLLRTGFEPGRIYELGYEARDPVVTGLGLAAIRDAVSFFRYQDRDRAGTPNPLLTGDGRLPRHVLGFGLSQSGRVIQTLLLDGLEIDEQRRPVFDGAFVHVAGGGKGGFNYRFAQTTRHFSHYEESIYPTDYFPFATTVQRDPVTGRRASVLDHAREARAVPRLIYTASSTDYWVRAASLLHTDPIGREDIDLDPKARAYLLAGAQHVVAVPEQREIYENCLSPVDYRPHLRALLTALDAWVSAGIAPPASRLPRIADGTLVEIDAYLAAAAPVPGRKPTGYLQPPYLDLGPDFDRTGVASRQPPVFGRHYGSLVPQVDSSGNDRAGVFAPEVQVPVGSFLGWNLRREPAGAPEGLARLYGSLIPFAPSAEARRASGDQRPSLAERYSSKDDYLGRVNAAVQAQVRDRLLLVADVPAVVARASGLYDRVRALPAGESSCRYQRAPGS